MKRKIENSFLTLDWCNSVEVHFKGSKHPFPSEIRKNETLELQKKEEEK